MTTAMPDARGRFGEFGGRYVPETLVGALERLEGEARRAFADDEFTTLLASELGSWVGRPTPLTQAPLLGAAWQLDLWLKREDLAHTGAHKINNAIGQALLAKRMGAVKVVAETGAGQHGVATAAACARLGLPCTVYMGAVDMERQAPNVQRMKLFGARVVAVTTGDRTLRSAIDEALRAWVADPRGTFYLLGSAVGPHPYPWLVRELQAVIGREARKQFQQATGGLPDAVIACVGGGSNAIGLFHPFIDDPVTLIGVEAGGRDHSVVAGSGPGVHTLHSEPRAPEAPTAATQATGRNGPEPGLTPPTAAANHAATIGWGTPGVLHGSYSLLLQDPNGQVIETHSVSAGLDYPGVGPEHAWLKSSGKAYYWTANDAEAVAALSECCRLEGIIPALETAHAFAGAREFGRRNPGTRVLLGCSGRGDKDLGILAEVMP